MKRETIHPSVQTIAARLLPWQEKIVAHPLIAELGTLPVLRLFMSQHVFVVWDFVNLIKTLHRQLCLNQFPWQPTHDPEAVRLLYEILMEEETDEDPDHPDQHCSHLHLYLKAMEECGAKTAPFKTLLAALRQGTPWSQSLAQATLLPSTRRFVSQTFTLCEQATAPVVAAYFVFGREGMVPQLFKPWLDVLKTSPATKRLTRLPYYLARHIDLDEAVHFPKAVQMLIKLCGDNPTVWQQVQQAAEAALQARLAFLEGIYVNIK